MLSNLVRITLAAIALAISLSTLSAQTATSIVCDRDNTLYHDALGGLSNGAGPSVFCGNTALNLPRRTLLHFDVVGNVPAGAVVISANLELFVAQSSAFLPIDVAVHRVSQDWGEGASVAGGLPFNNGGGGTAATPGDATWLHTFFPTIFWTNAGGDFAAAPSFTIPLPTFAAFQSLPLPGLIADVQSWLDNPAQNHGWLLKTDELAAITARRINSREAAGNRPTLNVTFLLPGETGTIGIGCPVGAGTFDLDITGAPIGGTTIQLDRTNAPVASVGVNFFSLGLDPVGLPLFLNCTLYLPVTQPIVPGDAFLSGAGAGSSPLLVPSGFPGFLISCQAAVLDATPISASLSNAAVMILQ